MKVVLLLIAEVREMEKVWARVPLSLEYDPVVGREKPLCIAATWVESAVKFQIQARRKYNAVWRQIPHKSPSQDRLRCVGDCRLVCSAHPDPAIMESSGMSFRRER